MVGSIVALNQIQKVPQILIIGTLTTVGSAGPVNIYTPPTGKKALVTSIKITYVACGTNNKMNIRIATILCDSSPGGGAADNPQRLNEKIQNNISLLPSQAIDATGDGAGNNGTINFVVTSLEMPQ